MTRVFVTTFLIAMSLLLTRPFSQPELDLDQLETDIVKTIEATKASVVSVNASFSGVIVSKEGHVLSAGHAVTPGVEYRIQLPDGRRFVGEGMGSSPDIDCALIKIRNPENLPVVEMGDSSILTVNQPCVSISFPGGQTDSRSSYIRFGRIVRTKARQGMVQSSCMMEPGDSGGPLFDLNGRVIGIHSQIGEDTEQNFEVPINAFKENWNRLNFPRRFDRTSSRPKLGIFPETAPGNKGVYIADFSRSGAAEAAGLKIDDLIIKLQNRPVKTRQDLRYVLQQATEKKASKIEVTYVRDGEQAEVTVPFRVEKVPEVPLPTFHRSAEPTAFEQLAKLPKLFADLESKLDDQCVVVTSQKDDQAVSIMATKIANTDLLVSKASRVGDNPTISINSEKVELSIVAREPATDLVLLKSPVASQDGIDLSGKAASDYEPGNFLLSPDPDGPGLVSVLSSPQFQSRRLSNVGFLGVVPVNDRRGARLRQVVQDGAAAKAGIERNDIISRLNDTDIKSANQLRRFLRTTDPSDVISAIVLRDGEELEKEIRLGEQSFPKFHVADRIKKSKRRDGFSLVFSHDADLKPRQCGGPAYDRKGNVVGINIARNSRVKSFAIPVKTIREFVESNRAAASPAVPR